MSVMKLYWPYIFLAYGALFVFGLLDNLRAPFFPEIISELNLTYAEASWFFATASLVAFFGSFIAPRVLHKLGSLWGMRLGLTLVTLGFGGFAFCQNLTQIVLFSATFGVGLGLLQVIQHVCIQEGAPEHLQRRLFNGLHSMYALAALMAPVLSSVFMSLNWDWRKSFLILCAFPVAGILQSIITKQRPSQGHEEVHVKVDRHEWPHMLYLAAIMAFYMSAELSASTRMVLYINRVLDVELVSATHYLSVFFLGLLVGRLLFTFFHFNNFSSRNIMATSVGLSAASYALGLTVSPWFLSLCGLTMAPAFATCMDFVTLCFKEKAPTAMSMALAFSSVMIMLMHYTVGQLSDIYGIGEALMLGPAFLAIAFLLLLAHPFLFKKNKK